MKKLIPFLCAFIILSVVFVSLAYAPQGDKPSEIAINDAVHWSESQVGKPMFPYSDGTGNNYSWLNSANFVSNAYGVPSLYSLTAGVFWYYTDQHPGDLNAPKGSLVFFKPCDSNFGKGLVALSAGGGNLIEAGYSFIAKSTIGEENKHAAYLGWAWPPLDWTGRSASLTATVYTWVIEITKAAALTAAAWGVFQIIRMIRRKRKAAKGDRASGSIAV